MPYRTVDPVRSILAFGKATMEPMSAPPVQTPPPLDPPPVTPPPGRPGMSKAQKKGLGGLLLTIGILGAKYGKFAWAALKGAKFLPFMKTFGSMFLTIWIYSTIYTWKFAAGFVFGIFIHEMGHVAAAALMGVPVTAPVFIPFFGAFILEKEAPKSAWAQAVIGIGGPIGGTIIGLIFLGIGWWFGSPLFIALAYVTFLLNLFNLTPIVPLDGGWITGSISPYLWLCGVLALATMFITGFLRNPFILILILLSLPSLWKGIRYGKFELSPDMRQSTPREKWTMGLLYVALVVFLAFATYETHLAAEMARPTPDAIRSAGQAA
jgi:Zn-dependent protease